MKKIGHFLKTKKLEKKTPLDDKSISHVFNSVIREEYGNRGIKNLKIDFLRGKKLFIKAENLNWASEIQLNKDSIIKKLNQELGSDEIEELALG